MANEEEMLPWMEEQKDNYNAGVEISTTTIICSLIIGMTAFNHLILPVMGLTAGYITSIQVNLLVGYSSYYTASLIISHLGKSKNMKESILSHFNGDYRYMVGYGIINWLSFLPIIFTFFNFSCLEIQGMLGYPSA